MPEYVVCATNLGDLDAFTRGYLECAEWCGLDEADKDAFEDADNPCWSDAALASAKADCKAFQDEAGDAIEGHESRAGHDFWLTRNRHGAGFWDGDWPKDVGQRLTEAAHAYGECDVWYDFDSDELRFH